MAVYTNSKVNDSGSCEQQNNYVIPKLTCMLLGLVLGVFFGISFGWITGVLLGLLLTFVLLLISFFLFVICKQEAIFSRAEGMLLFLFGIVTLALTYVFLFPTIPCTSVTVTPSAITVESSGEMILDMEIEIDITNPNYIELYADQVNVDLYYSDVLISESVIPELTVLQQQTTTTTTESSFIINADSALAYANDCFVPSLENGLVLPDTTSMFLQISFQLNNLQSFDITLPDIEIEVPCVLLGVAVFTETNSQESPEGC